MDPAALAGLVEGAFGYSTTRRLGAIDLPTAVVVGTHDLLTPPRTAQVLADGIPGATVTQLAGCGHMVMLERPDELAAAVDRLAARAAGEAGSPGEPAERPAAGSAA
jgi:pimeloyl-ACP methyl ester carboxylesterase